MVSGGLLALAHGTNDAQKTMGVITLALVANGNIASNNFHVPDWVVVSSATAIALGTYSAAGASSGRWAAASQDGHRAGLRGQGAGAAVILAPRTWASRSRRPTRSRAR